MGPMTISTQSELNSLRVTPLGQRVPPRGIEAKTRLGFPSQSGLSEAGTSHWCAAHEEVVSG